MFLDFNLLNEFMHGDPDHRIVLAKKIIQIFTTIQLKHDALEINAKKHNKFFRRHVSKQIHLQNQ